MVGSADSFSCATVFSCGRWPTGDRGDSGAAVAAGNSWKMAARKASFCTGSMAVGFVSAPGTEGESRKAVANGLSSSRVADVGGSAGGGAGRGWVVLDTGPSVSGISSSHRKPVSSWEAGLSSAAGAGGATPVSSLGRKPELSCSASFLWADVAVWFVSARSQASVEYPSCSGSWGSWKTVGSARIGAGARFGGGGFQSVRGVGGPKEEDSRERARREEDSDPTPGRGGGKGASSCDGWSCRRPS